MLSPHFLLQTNNDSCVKDILKEKSLEKTPYTLKPIGGERVKGSTIEACGQAFYVTTLKPCSYCPVQVPQQGGKCPSGNQTVFVGNSGMVCLRLDALQTQALTNVTLCSTSRYQEVSGSM